MALKDRLKDSRIKAKKTQAEVAEAVKMSQPAYQALESGKNLKSAFLPLIAQFLGVDAYWLTTGNTEDSFRESDVFSPTVVSSDVVDQYVWIEVVEASFLVVQVNQSNFILMQLMEKFLSLLLSLKKSAFLRNVCALLKLRAIA